MLGEESRSSWTENREGTVSNYLLGCFYLTTAMATERNSEQNIQTETSSEARRLFVYQTERGHKKGYVPGQMREQ